MKTIRLILLAVASACVLAFTARAQDTKTQATLTSFAGSVTISAPGGGNLPVTIGMKIPEGAQIVTAAGGRAAVEVHNGIVASVEPGTTVTLEQLGVTAGKRVARLNLKSGSLVSALDPTKKDTNDYGVRTPKGVAAARGTLFSTQVSLTGGTTVATLSGTVTMFLGPNNTNPIVIPIGAAATTVAGQQQVAALNTLLAGAGGAALKADIAAMVAQISNQVQTNGSGIPANAGLAQATLVAVVEAAAKAVPTEATNYVNVAVKAVVTTGSSMAANGTNAGTQYGAVRALTEAAVRANPSDALNIASSVASTVNTAVVEQAVAAAKAQPGATAASIQQSANDAVAKAKNLDTAVINGTDAGTNLVNASAITNVVNAAAKTAVASVASATSTTIAPPDAAQRTGDASSQSGLKGSGETSKVDVTIKSPN
ncbi:MAG: hypothetical protein RLZZ15_4470 [Verrucomicrobiota bacterium]|jgi:hypothetical protein